MIHPASPGSSRSRIIKAIQSQLPPPPQRLEPIRCQKPRQCRSSGYDAIFFSLREERNEDHKPGSLSQLDMVIVKVRVRSSEVGVDVVYVLNSRDMASRSDLFFGPCGRDLGRFIDHKSMNTSESDSRLSMEPK